MAETQTQEQEKIDGWAVLELMGHRRLGGRVKETTVAGAPFIRIDIPGGEKDGKDFATQFYAPGAVYAITPCSEEAARKLATLNRPQPVTRWEIQDADRRTLAASTQSDDDDLQL